MHDMAVVGERLTGAGVDWICESPGVIGFRDSDGNSVPENSHNIQETQPSTSVPSSAN